MKNGVETRTASFENGWRRVGLSLGIFSLRLMKIAQRERMSNNLFHFHLLIGAAIGPI
jgi:hypothetical protein